MGRTRRIHRATAIVAAAVVALAPAVVGTGTASAAVTPALAGPLHTTGTDSVIYDAANTPVRLVGFNWAGMEQGGRNDALKATDACGAIWRTPADGIGAVKFDDMYQRVRDWGYNVLRLPISWNDLEPVAPVWSDSLGRYDHTFNTAYINDLKSIVTKAQAAGLSVILDMHQDYWSPSLHHITNWDGSQGYCEGAGMPRWLNPSIDAKATTTQNTDFFNAMNQFYRNVRDPGSTLTRNSPWGLFYSAWDWISYNFSSRSGFPAASAVVGADVLNEPYVSYVGGNPPAGQTVLQAAGARLRTFYNALAPAIANWNPNWLLIFEDSTGGYYSANPLLRETPTMTGRPTVGKNWVYSTHIYNFGYGTFSDGVPRHDDYGVTVANAALANARAWNVPLYTGEFTNFTKGVDATTLTDADMAQTRLYLSWAKTNGVSWTFWSYVSGYRPMVVVNYVNNQPIEVVRAALGTGL
jgi:aryl-phospho-beta-D-glucosidase BglC (GH1 family)